MSTYLSATEAAKAANVSPRTLRRWLRSGRLTAFRNGHTLAISAEQIEAIRAPSGQAGRFEAAEEASGHGHETDTAALTASVSPVAASSSASTGEHGQDALLRAFDVIERQEATIMELSGRVGYYQAETEQLRTTLKALTAPQEPPQSFWQRVQVWLAP